MILILSMVVGGMLIGCDDSDLSGMSNGGSGKLSDKTPYSSHKAADKRADSARSRKSAVIGAGRGHSKAAPPVAVSPVESKPVPSAAAPAGQAKRVLPAQSAMGPKMGRPGMPFGPPGTQGRPFARPPG